MESRLMEYLWLTALGLMIGIVSRVAYVRFWLPMRAKCDEQKVLARERYYSRREQLEAKFWIVQVQSASRADCVGSIAISKTM